MIKAIEVKSVLQNVIQDIVRKKGKEPQGIGEKEEEQKRSKKVQKKMKKGVDNEKVLWYSIKAVARRPRRSRRQGRKNTAKRTKKVRKSCEKVIDKRKRLW